MKEPEIEKLALELIIENAQLRRRLTAANIRIEALELKFEFEFEQWKAIKRKGWAWWIRSNSRTKS
jgi:serine kinase of HPr protein (carbohydrate metabolism regulator)